MTRETPSRKRLYTNSLRAVMIGVWLVATVWGMVLFAKYSFEPAATGVVEGIWPADASIPHPTEGGFALVIAMHPECPCSKATLAQVDRLLAERSQAVHVTLLFVDAGTATEKSELWQRAARIPGVICVRDRDGAEARRFSFQTSGEARLYAPDGVLRFNGGLTIARGHEGASPGQSAVMAAIDSRGSAARISTPAFGCALFAAP